MPTPRKKSPMELAEDHWAWIEALMEKRQAETKYMFLEGFVHGYKHGKEDRKKK